MVNFTYNKKCSTAIVFTAEVVCQTIQDISQVIMSPMELKMQPTIQLQSKPEYGREKYPGLPYKCIVGCIFNSVWLIITREITCII
jgi:hypothetical protein